MNPDRFQNNVEFPDSSNGCKLAAFYNWPLLWIIPLFLSYLEIDISVNKYCKTYLNLFGCNTTYSNGVD